MGQLILWGVTTAIALFALYSSQWTPLHKRLLPWTGGVLIGVSVFWVLPDLAQDAGWALALSGILAGTFLLMLVDRYVYPVCPFCVLGMHQEHAHDRLTLARGRYLQVGWPVLLAGCIHNFFDGWMVELPHAASATSHALSWGFAAHKIPESFVVGLLASALTSRAKRGLAVVLLIQSAFALGSFSVLFARNLDSRVLSLCNAAAGATLLFFGLSALQLEWRLRGALPALRVGAFGIGGCGLVAFAMRLI